MATLESKFEVKFNVEKESSTGSDRERYKRFINLCRHLLSDRISHNRPVLCRQHNHPAGWFHVVLQTNSDQDTITLRIRLDNIYLDGYTMSNGQWLEFKSGTQLMPGSTILPFDGGYNALQAAAKRALSGLLLNQKSLTDAVYQLATSTDDQQRALSLMVVIQMICESIRFQKISQILEAPARCRDYEFRIPDWMLNLERSWGDLCSALLRADADPEVGFQLPQPNAVEIRTKEEAIKVIGVIQGLWYGHSEDGRVPRMVVNYGQWPQGRPMVEVFSVRVDEIKAEHPCKLYGIIKIEDGLDSFHIYDRKRDQYESISPGDTVLLTGPAARAISAYGSFTINLDLASEEADPLKDQEVSVGKISWNVYHTTSNECDKPLNEKVEGKHGSATVNYVVLRDAVRATVEIILISGNVENSAGVYGVLAARNGHYINESVLFKKKSEEVVDVYPGEVIPLSRSIVAVPLSSSLIVRAKLYDRKKDSSSDDEIANGTMAFTAQTSGVFHKNISGKQGKLKVKVTWDV